ncbi:GNAT family N-acetyltransferase [Actinospica durhamensis]|uniref:GNAT family N-acetyltransferase n=1 Tax=Actinospica durhamensis TaxID=1508375 RepID=A0A941IRS8_9ACTN|nr:GNAT family N-acetyltransferase [Actinospica durhamensis]MBR7835632.1 GNAT family N-acetyltransferase [Actinospica durhamensis]
MTVEITPLESVTPDVVEAFERLLPQLSARAPEIGEGELKRVAAWQGATVLLARLDGRIVGTLTLVLFPIPTGTRAWIEDVVVESSARGNGVGAALVHHALDLAREAGARTVDLTSRPSRVFAHRLYESVGFEVRDSRLYRYELSRP